jgi:hypothetical protein
VFFLAFYGLALTILVLFFSGRLRWGNPKWIFLALLAAVFPVVLAL